jgi:hypothetical protein
MTDRATVPFVATDSNGVVVHGYVEVHRPVPGGRNYGNPRAADPYFEFLETRDVCRIDQDVLKRAMFDALMGALRTIGMTDPDPDPGAVSDDVDEILSGVFAQCRANADKYVSTPDGVTLANLNQDDFRFS